MIQIFSNGTIYWALTSSSTGLCRVTTRFFPYDRHRCGVVFSPESYLNVFFRPMFDNVVVSIWVYLKVRLSIKESSLNPNKCLQQ